MAFELSVPEAGRVSLAVYDAIGRRVVHHDAVRYDPGLHRVGLELGALASGSYAVEVAHEVDGVRSVARQRVTVLR